MSDSDLINATLPDELILEIFRHLEANPIHDGCSLVFKRWLGLERFRRDTVRIGASATSGILIRQLSRRFPNIRSLFIDERISESPPDHYRRRRRAGRENCLSDYGLAVVGDNFIKLEKLSLIWCSSVTDIGLRSLAEKCKSLKSLDLQGCYIGDIGLAAVGECCNFLQDLNLRFCEGLTDSGLVPLAQGCGENLMSLGVAACAEITDVSLEAVGSHCRSLESLSLDSETFRNNGLIAVARGCSTLKVLKLQCLNISDEALEVVGFFCLARELLALYSFQKFTDRSLRAIGKGCKKLRNLTLIDCIFLRNKGLEYVAIGCSELTHIEVNGCLIETKNRRSAKNSAAQSLTAVHNIIDKMSPMNP